MSLAFFSLLLLVFSLGQSLAVENLQTWCVPKPSLRDSNMEDDIDFACSHLDNGDCDAIKPNNPCFDPKAITPQASYAMNAYYQKKGRHSWNCKFSDSGLVAITDPSFGSCTLPGGITTVDLSAEGKWCVAKPTATNAVLQENIDYACSHVDCSPIKPSGVCYEPTSLISQASVAMNLYYQATGKMDFACDFKGSGLVVIGDPSYGSCKFEFRH